MDVLSQNTWYDNCICDFQWWLFFQIFSCKTGTEQFILIYSKMTFCLRLETFNWINYLYLWREHERVSYMHICSRVFAFGWDYQCVYVRMCVCTGFFVLLLSQADIALIYWGRVRCFVTSTLYEKGDHHKNK